MSYAASADGREKDERQHHVGGSYMSAMTLAPYGQFAFIQRRFGQVLKTEAHHNRNIYYNLCIFLPSYHLPPTQHSDGMNI
jgi:hypothetical protein